MTPEQVTLANIVGDAEAHGHLDPKYGPHLHQQLSQLLDSMQRAHDMTKIELNVARAEADQLYAEREAARSYLSDRFFPVRATLDFSGGNPIEELRREVMRVLKDVGPDNKIQQIKALRSSQHASDAWAALGNEAHEGMVRFGLKDAKDVVDHAQHGSLWLGKQGGVTL